MLNQLALMMIMMWPAIHIFLIELHYGINFWRKIGAWTYLIVLLQALPIAFILYSLKEAILYYQIILGTPFIISGIMIVLAGLVLHAWTAKLIGIKATIGYTELKPSAQSNKQDLIKSGPFSVVRHPSYWAHTAIITGIFLITGVVAIGIIALIDLALNYFIVTTLEDQELIERFGYQYKEYQREVPKFFPKITQKKSQVSHKSS
jgi:protein-S-isoprenylcysteine O-methyltransferase Ste14